MVVCEDIVDHTNVGAIFRSAAAFGVDAVLLAPRCADPLYRRSVKVAMGAVFALPWTRMPDWHDALPAVAAHGFTTVALTLAEGSMPIDQAVAGWTGSPWCWVPRGMGSRRTGSARRSAAP